MGRTQFNFSILTAAVLHAVFFCLHNYAVFYKASRQGYTLLVHSLLLVLFMFDSSSDFSLSHACTHGLSMYILYVFMHCYETSCKVFLMINLAENKQHFCMQACPTCIFPVSYCIIYIPSQEKLQV